MPYTVHIHNWWVKSPEKIHIRVAFPGDYVSFEAFIFQGRLQGVETLIGKTWKDVGLYQNWWFWQEHVRKWGDFEDEKTIIPKWEICKEDGMKLTIFLWVKKKELGDHIV